MQNKKRPNHFHRLVEFAKGELEITLAVLIVLAFVIGYTYANTSTELDNGDVEIAQEVATITKLNINGQLSEGLNFTSTNISNLYRPRSGFNLGNIITTASGTRGATDTATYIYQLTLDQPVDNTFYLWGEYTQATVNDTLVRGSTGQISITGSNITITFSGGSNNVIARLVTYPGTEGSSTPPSVATLYVIPTIANLEVGTDRFFQIIALDPTGSSISPIIARWTITSGSEFATIGPNTGILTGIKPGGPVNVRAAVNGASASAAVTVKARESISLLLPPLTTQPSPTTSPSTGGGAGIDIDTPESGSALDRVTDALTQTTETGTTSEAVADALDLFSEKQTAQRLEEIDSARPTQQEINETVAQQTTFTQKVAARATAAIQEIKITFTEIFAGRDIQTENGTIVHIKSVFETISNFLSRLFLGIGTEQGEGGAGASTTGAGLGDEPN